MSEGGSIFRAIREGNDAFEGAYPGPKHEETFIRFDESAKNDIFETANGTTREKVQRKNEADVEALFRESKNENIDNVFEKEDHELPKNKEEVKGLDLNKINEVKAKLETQDQKIKEPSFEPSFGILK